MPITAGFLCSRILISQSVSNLKCHAILDHFPPSREKGLGAEIILLLLLYYTFYFFFTFFLLSILLTGRILFNYHHPSSTESLASVLPTLWPLSGIGDEALITAMSEAQFGYSIIRPSQGDPLKLKGKYGTIFIILSIYLIIYIIILYIYINLNIIIFY